jgi:RimJ/RimL family protein N-acetyltransferase
VGKAHEHRDFKRVRSPFEGAIVRLRAIEEDDLPRINEGILDPEVSQYLSMAWPEPLAGTREWWQRVRSSDRDATFVIETLAGEFVGGCGLHQVSSRNRSAILGIWLAKPHWEKGFGTDAVRTLCRFAFQEMNLQRVELGVLETNPRGVRAYEKVGFKEEGRLRRFMFVDGRYVDMIMMGLLAEDLIED